MCLSRSTQRRRDKAEDKFVTQLRETSGQGRGRLSRSTQRDVGTRQMTSLSRSTQRRRDKAEDKSSGSTQRRLDKTEDKFVTQHTETSGQGRGQVCNAAQRQTS